MEFLIGLAAKTGLVIVIMGCAVGIPIAAAKQIRRFWGR